MDLNQLIYHHQVALIRAVQARSLGAPKSRFDLVAHYARNIRAYRRKHGLTQY